MLCFPARLRRWHPLFGAPAVALAVVGATPCTAQNAPPAAAAAENADPGAPVKSLGVVTVTGARPTSLPTEIPTTTESITREQIERTINASDAEDALKYFPSLLVRKRYIGDYNHAILSSRASGTGNSARSAVYADGILLSNFLGNGVGGLAFPPRWGMVTSEEIDRVDVMYGPFSAAYPGNSVGAVVDYVTRMPTRLEAHARLGYVRQPFELYSTDRRYRAWEESASVGSRAGGFSWWLNYKHLDSTGQPLTFATRLVSSTVAVPAGGPAPAPVPVTGAVLGANNADAPWYILGSGTQFHTVQDHFKFKLAYDFAPSLRASYLFGIWRNGSDGDSQSYLRNAAGQTVTGTDGAVVIGGRNYAALSAADFAITRESLLHEMHGVSLKSHTQGEWDWEAAASSYAYQRDVKRQNSGKNVPPAAYEGGTGTLADGSGTGWSTLALKSSWRPQGPGGAHVVDFGFQQEQYKLRYLSSGIAGNYLGDAAGARISSVEGDTGLRSIYAQDAWRLGERWKAVLGGRAEHWDAHDGHIVIATTATPSCGLSGPAVCQDPPGRHENYFSPKAALSWQWLADTVLKTSVGRAVRMPTVAELYGATSTTNSQFINDPSLKPEKSWTGELSAERDFGSGLARLTFFAEDTRDSLYSQTTLEPTIAAVNKNVTRVQNVAHIATVGVEAAFNSSGFLATGLDLGGSVTYADSKIRDNAGFVTVPGDTIGKRQPNIPRWRATLQASYRFDEHWSASIAGRYSGRQYRTLNNADVSGYVYQGVSKFATVDLRAFYRFSRQWSGALGIDNANNDKYWNFHPYPQRSYTAELRFDL